ncbi:hypothetical protein JMG10_13390 [Nostoc ellipsosporum NOK]|nr:hypothetical protein [Nostoc ellipsosporum NOK]
MQKMLFICVLLITFFNTKAQLTDKIFVVESEMIESFDSAKYKITLTPDAQQRLKVTDFSKYSFLWISGSFTLIPIIESVAAIKISRMFIYRSRQNILPGDGVIKINFEHLDWNDCSLNEFKKTLLAIVKANGK